MPPAARSNEPEMNIDIVIIFPINGFDLKNTLQDLLLGFAMRTLATPVHTKDTDVNADVHEWNRCTHHRCVASGSGRPTVPHAARLNKRSASNPSSNNSTTGRATRKRDRGSGGDTKAPTTTQPNHT